LSVPEFIAGVETWYVINPMRCSVVTASQIFST